jgi:hypothetical protein
MAAPAPVDDDQVDPRVRSAGERMSSWVRHHYRWVQLSMAHGARRSAAFAFAMLAHDQVMRTYTMMDRCIAPVLVIASSRRSACSVQHRRRRGVPPPRILAVTPIVTMGSRSPSGRRRRSLAVIAGQAFSRSWCWRRATSGGASPRQRERGVLPCARRSWSERRSRTGATEMRRSDFQPLGYVC